MSWGADFARLSRLTWRDRLLLGETALALAKASIAIRAMPFRRLMTSLRDVQPADLNEAEIAQEIGRVQWAVQACARRLPWRIVCFQKGLALYRLLQRRSIAATLHYGVAQDDADLKAHVWVSRNGEALIGGEEAKSFVCLASFPRESLAPEAIAAS